MRRKAQEVIEWNPGEANPKQLLFFQSRTLYTAYGGAKGGGKALLNGTPVCTPDGWTAIERLREGDAVIGSDGKVCHVTGVYPQGVKAIYKVTFRDGFTIKASGDHLWKCRITGKPHKVGGRRVTRDRWEILTTLEMMEAHRARRSNQSVVIPLCGPIEWPKRELLIKPYTAGALIGDGCLCGKAVSMTSADEEVIDRIRADGYTVNKWRSGYEYGVHGVRGYVKELDLNHDSHSKRIPYDYLHSDVADRRELLRGLMDTDGFCDKRGHCSFCSVNKGLAEDVQYLVRSLGGMATVTQKNRRSGISYEVTIRMPDELQDIFHLSRKRERLRPYNAGVSDVTRRIVSIEEDGEGECTCIRVDNAEHLFVADGFTVTHNTWAVRVKAVGGALVNPGIRILIMRKTYPELEENHIRPILALVPPEAATYNGTSHLMTFANGSTIKFGHWADEASEREYQGLEYDWIFIDEATQFSERSFNYLGGCLRGISKYPKRMYLTCNPGGVGHRWVKRLFIDRQYKLDGDPEERENPEDYTFIPATVEDNTALLESSPGYLRMLAQMPEDLKKAYRYGDWDAIGGNYFPEFSVKTHVRKSFEIPKNWVRYRSFDYGLDMLAVYWWAVDQDGRSWCYREFCQKGLIVQEAAQKIKDLTHEPIAATYAPPDMWNRQKDTGRSMAEIYMENGIGLVRASNNRVQGHMLMKEALALKKVHDPYVKELFQTDALPGMMFFENCKNIINDIRDIQHDDNDPNDCAKEPHDITHTVDGVRYYCISRILSAEPEDEEEYVDPYEEYMTGGEITEGYLAC